ncbi:MAG TPA: orotidine 5'-phosphate decarboxylase / HUMPS family protein [Vicinamibacteria bacterium]
MNLQTAFDFIDLGKSLEIASKVAPHSQWLEVGTSLIKSEGIRSVREFKSRFPANVIVADMKVLDAGEREARLACDNGADIVVVEAGASDGTIQAVIKVARAAGVQIMYDLFGVEDLAKSAERAKAFGLDCLCFHKSTDAAGVGGFLEDFRKFRGLAGMPMAVAGKINDDTIGELLPLAPDTLIIGGAITGAPDPGAAARHFRERMDAGR